MSEGTRGEKILSNWAKLEVENAALTKRVAELEEFTQRLLSGENVTLQIVQPAIPESELLKHWVDQANHQLTRVHELEGIEQHLRSQLAWTPVSDGLPTEPGHYLFAACSSVTHAALVDATWFTPDGETFEPRGHFRRIELPKEGET